MGKNDVRSSEQARTSRSLDYLRKRSLHRIWWHSARIALRRGRPPLDQVIGQRTIGKGG